MTHDVMGHSLVYWAVDLVERGLMVTGWTHLRHDQRRRHASDPQLWPRFGGQGSP